MVTVSSSGSNVLTLFLKAFLFTAVFWLVLVIVTAGALAGFAYYQLKSFATAAGTTVPELKKLVERGWNEPVTNHEGYKNMLVLGVDSLAGRGTVPPLTDTMMIVSLQLSTGRLTVLPLPRDLWSDAYQTKINALYAYGRDRYPDHPERFPQEALTELTGVQFQHVVVLSIDQVAEIIDLLGGIEVKVEESFVDERFPRPDVDVTVERDPAKLYQRIEFTAGTEHMNGERALQFIRSRHASGTEGNDLARSRRQELVLAALMAKLQNVNTVSDLPLLARLYRYYLEHFNKVFSIEQGIATLKALWPHKSTLQLVPKTLSIYPQDPQGSLVNPPLNPRQYQGQWVYTVRNPDTFASEVQTLLFQP